MKPITNTQRINGTSFHQVTIEATVDELITILGEPAYNANNGSDKTNYEWEMETSQGQPFSVYDWKEYRVLPKYEVIQWHIGSHDKYSSLIAQDEIQDALNNLK